MKPNKQTSLVGALVAVVLLSTAPAMAADTIEHWDIGATNVDFYVGYDGMGLPAAERVLWGNIMYGYGIVDRLSAYLSVTLEGDGEFANGALGTNLGVYGTPVETNHVDLDLFLDFGLGGDDVLEIRPSFELNLDTVNDLRQFGVYLRSGVLVSARGLAGQPKGQTAYGIALDLEATLGMYWTVAPDHQLLAEVDLSYAFMEQGDANTRFDFGGVALGYNVFLHKQVEMINQVYLDIPQDGEPFAVGFFTGFIATLPAHDSPN